jgi:hypothetical protein
VGAHLVLENTRHPGSRGGRVPYAIGSSRELVSFCSAPLDLFSAPAKRRSTVQKTVASLTETPETQQKGTLLSLGVSRAHGLSLGDPQRATSWPSRPAWVSSGGFSSVRAIRALVELFALTLECCAIDPEASGGLGLGDPFLHRLYDLLLSEVQRIGTHAFSRYPAHLHRNLL